MECFIPIQIKIITDVIFYKSVQILAYADDIDIIARSRTALKEAFPSFERAAEKNGLKDKRQKDQVFGYKRK